MKSLIALSIALWSALTLTSCVDLAGIAAPTSGSGYGGGYNNGGYGNGGYSSGYRPPGSYYNNPSYNNPSYNNGYRPPNSYYNDHNDHNDHDDHSHGSSHSNSNNKDYFGGPEAWYKSGYAIGKKDRKEKRSCNYRRHSSQYDKKTESQFARGYNEGYH